MAMRPTAIWLADIREEIAGIRNLTAGSDEAGFAADWAMKRAVEHALLIISEAARHIPSNHKMDAPRCRGSKSMRLETCSDMNIAASDLRYYGPS